MFRYEFYTNSYIRQIYYTSRKSKWQQITQAITGVKVLFLNVVQIDNIKTVLVRVAIQYYVHVYVYMSVHIRVGRY